MKSNHFLYCKGVLEKYDAEVAYWTEEIRPLCTIHQQVEEITWWEFVKRSWKMKERCPRCRGYYTKWGYPKAPRNLLDCMLTVHYGPALTEQLNAARPILQF